MIGMMNFQGYYIRIYEPLLFPADLPPARGALVGRRGSPTYAGRFRLRRNGFGGQVGGQARIAQITPSFKAESTRAKLDWTLALNELDELLS